MRFYTDESSPDECWPWTGALNKFGYGVFGYKGRSQLAHRMTYAVKVGDIPEDRVVMHTCNNPKCVNPNHLRLGTQGENVRDMFQKGRALRPTGELHHRSKLTADQVLEIRQLAESGVPRREIVERYPVNLTAIGRIINRQTWKDLPHG